MAFEVFLADPPWKFTNKRTGGSMKSGSSQKYPTMELAAIQQLAIPAVTAANAVLFLWTPTSLKFSHGGTTLAAWGFRYKTTIYWDKQRNGMGFWLRNYVEELLIGIRGDVAPWRSKLPNIIHQPPTKHSEKPEAFRTLIEQATGIVSANRCLELFAQRRVAGWTSIGKVVTGRDIRADLRDLVVA